MQTEDPLILVFGFLLKVLVAGGGLVLIVYQAFKHLSVKWLDSKFDERLQSFRYKQGKEIEELRLKIATMLDRTVKLNQREYDVLPEAWSKINEAYWATGSLVAPTRHYPDFGQLNATEQDDLINRCNLPEVDKQKIQETSDPQEKTNIYRESLDWMDLIKAEEKSRESAIFLAKNGIFISNHINEKFDKLKTLIWRTLIEKRINNENRKGPTMEHMYEESHKFIRDGDKQLKILERLVHDRLWFAESGPSCQGDLEQRNPDGGTNPQGP